MGKLGLEEATCNLPAGIPLVDHVFEHRPWSDDQSKPDALRNIIRIFVLICWVSFVDPIEGQPLLPNEVYGL